MSDDRYAISVINAINGIFDALAICHKLVQCMSIWVSKEAFGPQECSQRLKKSKFVGSRGQKLTLSISEKFLCIFLKFLCIKYDARGSSSRPPRELV